MNKIYKLNGEDVYANGKKVKQTEEAGYSNKRLKTTALIALSVLVIGLNAYGIGKYIANSKAQEAKYKSEYAYGFDIDETDWCEPEIVTRYVAPSGYTLVTIDGITYAVKETKTYASIETHTDSTGKTTYSAPAGYILATEDGVPVAYKIEKIMVSPSTVQEYSAPEGYVLIGDKCFKLNETQEKSNGK